MMKLVKEKFIWILLLLSCAIRIYVWRMTPVVNRDGLDFINIAKRFAEGNFQEALSYHFHPLYPLFISLGSICGLEFEYSGRLVSLILSIFTVVAMYIIGKKMFNRTVGFIAAFLLSIHPYAVRLSVDVMSDCTYFFFYLAGFGLGYFAINTQRLHYYVLAGAAGALAYLTRPEGTSVLLITGAWVFIYAVKTFLKSRRLDNRSQGQIESKLQLRKAIKSICLLVIGFLIFSSPYILYLKGETGTWTLSKKKRLSHVTGVNILLDQEGISDETIQSAIKTPEKSSPSDEKNKKPDASSLLSDLQSKTQFFTPEEVALLKQKADQPYYVVFYKLILQYFDSLHYPILLFLIIGIACMIRITGNRSPNLYIISYIVIFVFVLFFLQKTVGYVSYRHLINIVLVTLFWAAIGINISYCWIMNRTFGLHVADDGLTINNQTSNIQSATADWTTVNSKHFVIFLCIIAALILPKTLKSHRTDKLIRKEAGMWLKEHHHGKMTIIADRLIVALYADTKGVQLPKTISGYEEIVAFARSKKADYLVVTENIEDSCPNFFNNVLARDLKKLIKFGSKENKVIIYEVMGNPDNSILDEWDVK